MAEEKFNSKEALDELVEIFYSTPEKPLPSQILVLYQKIEAKLSDIDKKGYERGYYDVVKIRKQVDEK